MVIIRSISRSIPSISKAQSGHAQSLGRLASATCSVSPPSSQFSTASSSSSTSKTKLNTSSRFNSRSIQQRPSTSTSSFKRFSSSKSSSPSTIQLSPTREPTIDLEEDDPDLFTSLNLIQKKVNLTDRAVEKLISLCEKESNQNLGLRLAVEPGGCHGYQYKMEVVDIAMEGEGGMEEDDFLFSTSTSSSSLTANLLIDSSSLPLLSLATLDYATELIGSQFVVRENPNAKGGGCGCGVSWEPRDDLPGSKGGVEAEKTGPIKEGLFESRNGKGVGPGEIEIGEKGRGRREATL